MELFDDNVNEIERLLLQDMDFYKNDNVVAVGQSRMNERLLDNESNWRVLLWYGDKGLMYAFKKSISLIDFSKVNSWIDIGCGTGEYFDFIMNKMKNENIKRFVGVDINSGILERMDNYLKDNSKIPYNLINCDIANDDLNVLLDNEKFDLVTMTGVITMMNMNDIQQVFDKLKLLSNNITQFFVTGVNYNMPVPKRKYGIFTRYKKEELEYMFKKSNFKNISSDIYNTHFVYVYGTN